MNFEKFLGEQKDEFLQSCFNEIEDFRINGVLTQGKVRELNKEFFNDSPRTIFTISQMVYREIAIRHFKEI